MINVKMRSLTGKINASLVLSERVGALSLVGEEYQGSALLNCWVCRMLQDNKILDLWNIIYAEHIW